MYFSHRGTDARTKTATATRTWGGLQARQNFFALKMVDDTKNGPDADDNPGGDQ